MVGDWGYIGMIVLITDRVEMCIIMFVDSLMLTVTIISAEAMVSRKQFRDTC